MCGTELKFCFQNVLGEAYGRSGEYSQTHWIWETQQLEFDFGISTRPSAYLISLQNKMSKQRIKMIIYFYITVFAGTEIKK